MGEHEAVDPGVDELLELETFSEADAEAHVEFLVARVVVTARRLVRERSPDPGVDPKQRGPM